MSDWETVPGETPIDISGLRLRYIKTRADLSEAEATNILDATIKYLSSPPTRRQAPFNTKWSCKLHREMFGQVWSWAGKFRRVELNIGVPAHQIETQLQNLFDDLAYQRESQSTSPLEQSVALHHRAVLIHPFANGNGRWARMLANIWLLQLRQPIVRWPDVVIGNESKLRREYIAAIRLADRGDLGALTKMHARFQMQ